MAGKLSPGLEVSCTATTRERSITSEIKIVATARRSAPFLKVLLKLRAATVQQLQTSE